MKMENDKQSARKKPTPRSQAFKLRKNIGDAIPPTTSLDNNVKSQQPHCFCTLTALLQSGLMLSKTTKSPLEFIFQSAMDLMTDCTNAYQEFPAKLSILELKNADLQQQLDALNSELDQTKESLTTTQQQVEIHRLNQERYASALYEKGRMIRKRARDNNILPSPSQSAATISTLRAVLRHQDLRYDELHKSFETASEELCSSTSGLLDRHEFLLREYQTRKLEVDFHKRELHDLRTETSKLRNQQHDLQMHLSVLQLENKTLVEKNKAAYHTITVKRYNQPSFKLHGKEYFYNQAIQKDYHLQQIRFLLLPPDTFPASLDHSAFDHDAW
jgi:cob(I)alamin adenosyltransferase